MRTFIFTCVTLEVNHKLQTMWPTSFTFLVDAHISSAAKAIGTELCELKFPEKDGFVRPLVVSVRELDEFMAQEHVTAEEVTQLKRSLSGG